MPPSPRLLSRGSWPEAKRITEVLRRETVGGVLLLIAAGAALVWANSPWAQAYRTVSESTIGPERLHLRLSAGGWAADGLLAMAVIATLFTDHLALGPLALALIPGGLFAVAVQRGVGRWWILVPLAAATWALVHASGVHATVAGVVLGFTVPVLGRHAAAECFEHLLRPLSAGVAVRVFAFFAAGVTVGGWAGLGASLQNPVTLGVLVGLVVGKPVGVFITTLLLARFTGAALDDDLEWRDVLGVALLAGIGFTVSLLIGELAFGYGTVTGADAKIGVLAGSLVAGALAAVLLVSRNATYRRIHVRETIDADDDGVPDVYSP